MTGHLKSVFLAAALVAAAGCGGDKKGEAKKPEGGGEPKAAAAGGAGGGGGKYDASKSTASVKITVKWTGAMPKQQEVSISEATCKTATPVMNPRFVVNAGGAMPDAFVWAVDGPHKKLSGGYPEPAAFTLDQHGCMYSPHVFGVRVDQKWTVKNSDGTKHNVHAHPADTNKEYNVPQDPGATSEFTWAKKEKALQINCDVHSWMSSFAFVVDHPFFGTSNADGAVEIKGLPAGDYTFKVWHEQFSGDKAMETDVKVTLKDGESKDVAVEMK